MKFLYGFNAFDNISAFMLSILKQNKGNDNYPLPKTKYLKG